MTEYVTCKNCGREKIPLGSDRCPDCKALVKGSPLAKRGGRSHSPDERAHKLLAEFGHEWETAPEYLKLLAERAVKGGQGDVKIFLQQMEELKPAPRAGAEKPSDAITKIVVTGETTEAALSTLRHLQDYIVLAERMIDERKSRLDGGDKAE